MKGLLFISRLLIGGIFIFSGWQKLTVPVENFQASLEAYKFFPSFLISPISYTVPWMEFFFGIFLVIGFLVRAVSLAISAFLGVFIVVLAKAVILQLPITSCGCFGEGLVLTPVQSLTLDSGLLILAVLLLRFSSDFLSVDGLAAKMTSQSERKVYT